MVFLQIKDEAEERMERHNAMDLKLAMDAAAAYMRLSR